MLRITCVYIVRVSAEVSLHIESTNLCSTTIWTDAAVIRSSNSRIVRFHIFLIPAIYPRVFPLAHMDIYSTLRCQCERENIRDERFMFVPGFSSMMYLLYLQIHKICEGNKVCLVARNHSLFLSPNSNFCEKSRKQTLVRIFSTFRQNDNILELLIFNWIYKSFFISTNRNTSRIPFGNFNILVKGWKYWC